jgi:cell division protease FtsH
MNDRRNGSNPATGPGKGPAFPSRPKESDRLTRAPMLLWDRVRILSFLIGAFLLLTWGSMSINGTGFLETIRAQSRSRWWLLVLIGIEALRQINYLLLEGSPRYYRRWTAFWGRERASDRIDPWTRFRLGRVLKILAFLWIVGMVIAAFFVNADGSHLTPIQGLFLGPVLLFQALPQILQFVFIITLGVLQFVAIFWYMSKGGVDTYMPDDIDTRFSDVKGQDAVLSRVKESLIFMEDPESIEARGGYVPGGILLWGPPGTGKTLLAQAVAGETAKPFVFVEPGAFNAMFMGVGILKVKGLYRRLRKLALRYGGVIVFFDEADSLGNRGALSQPGGGWSFEPGWAAASACHGAAYVSEPARSALVHGPSMYGALPQREAVVMGGMGMGGGGMGTLQAMLAEMSGLTKPRGFVNRHVRRLLGLKPKPPPKYRILHIFATNMPGALDEAMLRPGRIDRLYKVGYPQVEGRIATFRYYLAKVQHELADEQIRKLATITPYATGASIKDMVNEALVIAIRDERETITWSDIIQAKQLKEHGLPDDHEYIERERHSVAVHEASHAVVAYRLRRHMTIDIATIERRGDVGGFVSSIPPEDQFVQWRSERDVDIMTFLASLAGERLFFDGDNSAGVGVDRGDDGGVLGDGSDDRLVLGEPRRDERGSARRGRHRPRDARRRVRASDRSEARRSLREDPGDPGGEPRRGARGGPRPRDAQVDHRGRRGRDHRRARGLARGRAPVPRSRVPKTPRGLPRDRVGGPSDARRRRGLDPRADASGPLGAGRREHRGDRARRRQRGILTA